MSTVVITAENAQKAFDSANQETKNTLAILMPDVFKRPIMDRVKSWGDLCSIKGIDPVYSLPYPNEQSDHEKAVNALHKIMTIADLFNQEAEFTGNHYYPYFDISGGGFSFCDFICDSTYSVVGARLSFHSKQHAIYAGKQFIDIYKLYHTK